jgi:hypothetical protein
LLYNLEMEVPRFDLDLLDDEDPFEVDSQAAHLFKHPHLGIEDIDDVWANDPLFYPAKPPAHWLMCARSPAGFWSFPWLQHATAIYAVADQSAATRPLRASPPNTGGTDEHLYDARPGIRLLRPAGKPRTTRASTAPPATA